MRKQGILSRKRYAIWRAHEERCIYCRETLRYRDVWIDHILPESLLNAPQELQRVIEEYGLSPDFSINDHCNWVPSHWRCNLDKGRTIFERGTALYYIGIAQSKSDKAREIERRTIQNLKADKLLGSLEIAIDEGLLSKEAVASIIQQRLEPEEEIYEPVVITFGLTIYKVLDSGLLERDVPTNYPALCDWLEKDLIRQLKSLLSCEFYYTEASGRDGETLSVRLAFIQLDCDELNRFTSPWWEILEVAPYSEIYDAIDEGLS